MPPQQSVLQVALVPGELPQSAPPEGALPIVYAERVVGWATPTIARVEDAEAVAAFRALDVPLGWRVRAVLEPVPPAAAPLVLGGTITSAGEAISTPAAQAAVAEAHRLFAESLARPYKDAAAEAIAEFEAARARRRETIGEVADDVVYGESGKLMLPDGRLVEHGVLMVDGRRVETHRERGDLAKEIKKMDLHYGPSEIAEEGEISVQIVRGVKP